MRGICLATRSIRVLVVDDFESFRQFLSSRLRDMSDVHVCGKASDGLEAVQKAKELQPDLILLDIGLPKLNGIEAARRIRKVSSKSKILFVSQESSVDVVREALRVGARGYIVKSDAGSELPTAVNAVLRGERFVGSRFVGHDFTDGMDSQDPDDLSRNRVLVSHASTLLRKTEIPLRHEVQFYSDDAILLDGLTQFVEAALKVGNAAIVVATESHRDSLHLRLQSHGLDIAGAIEEGRYIALDAADTLSTFMLNDTPDTVRFLGLLGNLIATAAKATKKKHARVAIFGECVHLLWTQGNAEAAIQVEKLGNHLAKTYDVDILCGYSLGSFQGGVGSHIFARICAEHSAVRSL